MATNVTNMNGTNNATMDQQRLFNWTMENCQRIGNKVFVFIPTELLVVDPRFQRVEESSKTKIRDLANKWDDNKMDALKVSAHPDTFEFSIIDGYHRFSAGVMKEFTGFSCELLQGLSDNPEERLIQEATLFATQTDEVDILSPVMKHKANVIRGVKGNVALQELVEKYSISLKKPGARGRAKIGYLSGFSAALKIANSDETKLDRIFEIICESRWNLATNGFSSYVLDVLKNIMLLHNTNYDAAIVKYFRNIEPEQFFSEAKAKYPERKTNEALTLFLEDVVCEAGATRVYFGGRVQDVRRTA